MSATPRFKGVALTLGDETFVVPPLTLGAFEDHGDALRAFDGSPSKDNVRLVVDPLTSALKRNYPEITREKVRDLVDLSTMSQAMFALMSVSGATEAPEGNTVATATGGTGSPSSPT